mgnify:CR=1 FL=1
MNKKDKIIKYKNKNRTIDTTSIIKSHLWENISDNIHNSRLILNTIKEYFINWCLSKGYIFSDDITTKNEWLKIILSFLCYEKFSTKININNYTITNLKYSHLKYDSIERLTSSIIKINLTAINFNSSFITTRCYYITS